MPQQSRNGLGFWCSLALAIVGAWLVEPAPAADSPVIQIVTADDSVESIKTAVEELSLYLPKLTNSKIERVSTAVWKPSAVPAIVLGLAPKGTEIGSEKRDAYRLMSRGQTLFIFGDDDAGPTDTAVPKGTLFGVYDHLRTEYGVRWIFPGPQGEVVPTKVQKVKVAGIDRQSAPSFVQRVISTGTWLDAPQALRQSLERTDDEDRRLLRSHRQWMLRNRLHTRRFVDSSHAFTDWWDKHRVEHPEWFAQQRNGQRVLASKPTSVKLCTSNPEVVKMAVKSGLERVGENRWMMSISGSPNDSGITGFCMCPDCRRLDPPAAPKLQLQDTNGAFKYASLSDRHVAFWNSMAVELEKTRPDLQVAGYAYFSTSLPPVREKLHPKVLIGFVQHAACYWHKGTHRDEQRKFAGWADTGAKSLWRPNTLQIGHGAPTNFVSMLAKDLAFVSQNGCESVSYDALVPHWGTMGHTYYMLAQLLWDADQKPALLWEDYLQTAFGPAAEPMRAYFGELQLMTADIYRSEKLDANAWRQSGEQLAASNLSGARWLKLKQHLADARKLSGAYAPARNSLDLIDTAFEYWQLQFAVSQAMYAGPTPLNFKQGPLAESIAARDQWLRTHPKQLAVSTTDAAVTAGLMQKFAPGYRAASATKAVVDE